MNSDNRARRLFTGKERLALLADANGHCRACGAELRAGFHADHMTPFSQGGATDVVNGQALCPSCNLAKGAKAPADFAGMSQEASGMMTTADAAPIERPTPASADREPTPRMLRTPHLRPWQQQGADYWLNLRTQASRDMMVVACPGAGKTNLALYLASRELSTGHCDLVVVVVPTRQLKRQWARCALTFGITMTACWGNGAAGLPADVAGVVVTYSQVARLPEAVRLLCGQRRVLAILDEIHHGGDGLCWGDGLREAFEGAEARLCLSGTPFRTDGLNIPFARYDRQGVVISDVRYPLVQGLSDAILRPVLFHAFGARVRWRDGNGEHDATFRDRLGEVAQGRRLRAVLDPEGGWLPQVLRHAAAGLQEMRPLHPKSKGFVVCADAAHARSVALRLDEITGIAPTLALGDDPASAEALERFRGDPSSWLVVCQLAGEGFDLPDLRVCVYASTTCTALSFFQTVGRIIRMVPGLRDQFGAVYMPADPRLVALAEAYLDEAAVTFGREADDAGRARRAGHAEGAFRILSSEATAPEIIADGEVIPQEVLGEAQALKVTRPHLVHVPNCYIAALLAGVRAGRREFEQTGLDSLAEVADAFADALAPGGATTTGDRSEVQSEAQLDAETYNRPDSETYDERVTRLRRDCRRLAALIADELDSSLMEIERFYLEHLGFGQSGATLAQLEYKHNVLLRKVGELRTAMD